MDLDLNPFRQAIADPPSAGKLIDGPFVARLERMELLSRKIFMGRMKGDRRSKQKGQSVEFADYRNYVVGDDLRFLDWNLYGRLDKLYLRLFLEEEDLLVNVLVDTSASMNFGSPGKWRYACQVAAAIGYIGLCNNDRLSCFTFGDKLTGQRTGLRGRRNLARVLEFFERSELAEGSTNFAEAARQFALTQPRSGVVIVISDFYDKAGYEQGFRYLYGPSMDVFAIHVMSPQELEPELAGDLKLVDAEDGTTRELTVSKPLLDRYHDHLAEHCDGLKSYCTRRGIGYEMVRTDTPIDQLLIGHLRKRGLVR